MFEDSMLESASSFAMRQRWPAMAAALLQISLAATVLVVPMLHPERLALGVATLSLSSPPPPPTPPIPRVQGMAEQAEASPQAASPAAPAMQAARLDLAPTHIEAECAPVNVSDLTTLRPVMSAGNHLPAFASETPRPAIAVAATPAPTRVHISQGVSAGLLLAPIVPLYPPIARAAHIEGTVVVDAVISKTGSVESAKAVSGPIMLYGAALDGVRRARYMPYRLNGETVDVETTFTIHFRLGGGAE